MNFQYLNAMNLKVEHYLNKHKYIHKWQMSPEILQKMDDPKKS